MNAIYQHDLQELWDRSIAPHVWNQYHAQLDMYLRLACGPPKDILDVGCAQATLAIKLAEAGHRVTALDIRGEFLTYAQSRYTHGDIRFVVGNVLEMSSEDQFDMVFANQIVEHVVYPRRLVERLVAVLRPGGCLVMTTPNWEYVKNDLPSYSRIDPHLSEHRQFSADADGHFFAYRASELQEVFTDCGLENVEVAFFETPWISGHMKIRHLHRIIPAPVLHVLDRMTLRVPWLGRKLAHQMLVTGARGA